MYDNNLYKVILLKSLWKFKGELISLARLVPEVSKLKQYYHTNPPVVIVRMGLQGSEKFPKGIERCEGQERGISARQRQPKCGD